MEKRKWKGHSIQATGHQANQNQKGLWALMSKFYLPFSIICLVVVIFLDWLPVNYCCPVVERFFTSMDQSPYVSTSLVIWTFGTSLLIYFMGKMGDRCFGIHYYEVLLAQEQKHQWVGKLAVFFVEIVLLEIIATCPCPITLFTISMLQLFNIVFILLMVINETSQSNVTNAIKKQNQKVLKRLVGEAKGIEGDSSTNLRKLEQFIDEEKRDWLLIKAMRGLNYSSFEDMECLADSLLPQEDDLSNIPEPMQLILFWKLGCLMLENGTTWEGVPTAMNQLLIAVAANSNYSVAVKEGLLAALAVRGDTWDYQDRFKDMLERIDDPQRGTIIDWSYGLLTEIAANRTYAWKTRLLDSLEEYGPNYGCQAHHVLEPENKIQLTAFINYLTNTDETGPHKTNSDHMAGAIKEGTAGHA